MSRVLAIGRVQGSVLVLGIPARCSRLPLDSASRWTPLSSTVPSHYQADLVLSPVRNVRRQAHDKKTPAVWPEFYRLEKGLPHY